MRTPVRAILFGVLAATTGCGAFDSKENDDYVAPPTSSAKTSTLRYADVTPILKAHCVPCHAEVGGYAGVALDTQAYVQINLGRAIGCIEGNCPTTETKKMPPGRARWKESDREKLLAWLKAGAKK